MPNSTVGKSMVAQAISALENWQLNHHHLHKDNIEAQIGLRSDNRIRTIEDATKRNELRQIESSQVLKAAGMSLGPGGSFFPCLFLSYKPLSQICTLKTSLLVAHGGA